MVQFKNYQGITTQACNSQLVPGTFDKKPVLYTRWELAVSVNVLIEETPIILLLLLIIVFINSSN